MSRAPRRHNSASLRAAALALCSTAMFALSCAPPTNPTSMMGSIDSGDGFSCARSIVPDGPLKCWGPNQYGQTGTGSTSAGVFTAQPVTGLSGVKAVATGWNHACALLAGGTVKCWGLNNYGQLGNGSTTNSSVPVGVTGISTATEITAGREHTCARLADGTARCWGQGANGRLGNGTTSNALTPEAVTGLTGLIGIDAGANHTCAVVESGAVRCWGWNGEQQLGSATPPYESALPLTVDGLTGATSVVAGATFNCARIVDGTARCWGDGTSGKLGNGSTASSATPVTVSGLSDVVALAAGWNHTCALLDVGTIKCWGYNLVGNLGDGTSDPRSTPVTAVSSLPGAVAISAGKAVTCAIWSDSIARCWGANVDGSLGTGDSTGWFPPHPVVGYP